VEGPDDQAPGRLTVATTHNLVLVLASAAIWATWSTTCGYVAHRLAPRVLDHDGWLLRLLPAERDGRMYDRVLHIKRWKDSLPEAGSLFRGGFSKRRITRHDRAFLERFVIETRRAELAHWAILALGPLFLVAIPLVDMPWWLAAAMVSYAVVANVPCILVQRYNRARLERMLIARTSYRPTLCGMPDRELRDDDVLDDPIAQLQRWLDEARDADLHDWDAMLVATADADGSPSARVVLLRGVDERGLRFYTNYESKKGRDLDVNPRAAVVLHWREQGRQVRATGDVERLTPAESVEYWQHRPRASRLSAWASRQSEPVGDRAVLEATVAEVTQRFEGVEDLPLPPFWGGYLVVLDTLELWQHRDDRLHDRIRYRRDGDRWVRERLQP
jgi:pyridoxamine 5'-phosphate oxidase